VTRVARVVSAAIAGSIAIGACGGGGDGISTAARDRLTPVVAQVRNRAGAHDATGAARALATLRQDVGQLRRRGEIDDDDAAAILQAAAAVRNRLALITTTTTTTTPVTTPEPPGPRKPPKPPGKDKGPGKGPKPGHEKDDKHGG
jgi:hypothetical protein